MSTNPEAFQVARSAVTRTPRRPRTTATPVTVIKVDPVVWAEAQRISNNGERIIRIVSETCVIVTNQIKEATNWHTR